MTKLLRAIHANRGIEATYRRRLKALIKEMSSSVEYWTAAAYKKYPPRMLAEIAQDASPSERIKKIFDDLAARWIKRFDDEAPKVAQAYANGLFKATDAAFMAALKEAGFVVQFRMTPAVRDVLNASVAENVALIKSIPAQYLQKIEGEVMRAYTSGKDLQALVKGIQAARPVTDRRAALIARDQTSKANAVVTRARQMELGITQAKWMHSGGGKEPRPDHVAANGTIYEIDKGCKISGEFIQPGEEINCRCTCRAILPF
jgi:SPP1 gp7 family putative phage head morphogenesis protein